VIYSKDLLNPRRHQRTNYDRFSRSGDRSTDAQAHATKQIVLRRIDVVLMAASLISCPIVKLRTCCLCPVDVTAVAVHSPFLIHASSVLHLLLQSAGDGLQTEAQWRVHIEVVAVNSLYEVFATLAPSSGH